MSRKTGSYRLLFTGFVPASQPEVDAFDAALRVAPTYGDKLVRTRRATEISPKLRVRPVYRTSRQL